MSAVPLITYRHTQRAPFWLVLCGMSLLFFVLSMQLREEPVVSIILPIAGSVMLLLALSFRELTVKDELDQLVVQFGPLPLFQRRIRYDDIVRVEIDKTVLLEGWGIHMSPRGGWVWNIWGRDCVVIHMRRGTLRVGTDDTENLAGFLKSRMPEPNK